MQQPQHDLRAFHTSVASPRRLIAGVAAIGLQVLAIWALATGLAQQLIQKLPEEIKAEVVQQKPPEQEKTPPPPPPDLAKPPPPFVPPPDIMIQSEAPATNAIQNVQSVQKTPPAITAPASIGRAHTCANEYPALATRLGHQGKVTLAFHIATDGSVKDASVVDSSGYDELDQAAISCASKWRYKPAIQNGQPIEVPWKTVVNYNLRGD
jgi:protein TonB